MSKAIVDIIKTNHFSFHMSGYKTTYTQN